MPVTVTVMPSSATWSHSQVTQVKEGWRSARQVTGQWPLNTKICASALCRDATQRPFSSTPALRELHTKFLNAIRIRMRTHSYLFIIFRVVCTAARGRKGHCRGVGRSELPTRGVGPRAHAACNIQPCAANKRHTDEATVCTYTGQGFWTWRWRCHVDKPAIPLSTRPRAAGAGCVFTCMMRRRHARTGNYNGWHQQRWQQEQEQGQC